MSEEVIDQLVVTLGLKIDKYLAEAQKVRQANNDLGKKAKSLDRDFANVARSAAGFMAALTGSASLVGFIAKVTDGSAALDRMARNLDTTTESISAWSGAVEQAGGNAESAQNTLQNLSMAMTEILVTGNSGMLPYFRALGVNLLDAQKSGDPLSYTLYAISDGLQQISATQGRSTAYNLGKMMGIDADTLNLLLQGRKAVEQMMARQKQIGLVTTDNARQASKLKQQWVELKQTATAAGRELVAELSPALVLVLHGIQELMSHKAALFGFLSVLAIGAALAVGPWILMAARVTAVAAAVGVLADDWYTWLTGGKALFADFYQFVADKWHALMETLTLEGLKKKWLAFKAWLRGEKAPAAPQAKAPAAPAAPQTDSSSTMAYRQGLMRSSAAREAMDYFVSQGWSREAAIGIVANLVTESGLNANAFGDHGHAYGIAQWHPSRQRDFKKWAGKDIRLSTLQEQLAFYHYELTQGKEQAAGNRLRNATSKRQAAEIVSRYNERPADREGEAARRGALAASFPSMPPALLMRHGAPASQTTNDVSIGQITVVTQATDAPGIARDIAASLRTQNLVLQSDTGMQ